MLWWLRRPVEAGRWALTLTYGGERRLRRLGAADPIRWFPFCHFIDCFVIWCELQHESLTDFDSVGA